MTDEQLQQLAALAQAATPGPWEVRYNMLYAEDASPALDQDVNAYVHTTVCADPCDDGYVCGTGAEESCHADAEFIAAARDAVPALVADVQRLRGELEHLRMYERVVNAAVRALGKTGWHSSALELVSDVESLLRQNAALEKRVQP